MSSSSHEVSTGIARTCARVIESAKGDQYAQAPVSASELANCRQVRAPAPANDSAKKTEISARQLLEKGGMSELNRYVRQRFREKRRESNREKWRNRPRCGGKRRSDGQPCQAPAMPGKSRCRWHGGASTGPKTEAGKRRVTENLQKTPSHRVHMQRARPSKSIRIEAPLEES